MQKTLKKIDRGIDIAQTAFCGFGMFVIVALVFAMVFWRYVLNNSIIWAEEILRYIDMWVILVGAGITARVDEHVCIDVMQSILGRWPKLRIAHYIFTRAVVCAILLYLLPASFELIAKSAASHATSVPSLAMSVVYWAFPAGVFSIIAGYASATPRKIREILAEEKAKKAEKEGISEPEEEEVAAID